MAGVQELLKEFQTGLIVKQFVRHEINKSGKDAFGFPDSKGQSLWPQNIHISNPEQ